MNYNELVLAKPKVNTLIQLPLKPHAPDYVGQALNSDIRSHWIECLFNCFDKMHNSDTLSYPFLRIKIPDGEKVLPTRLTIVKLTDVLNYYEIIVRMCARDVPGLGGTFYDIGSYNF